MKKTLFLLLVAFVCLALVACGGSKKEADNETEAAQGTEEVQDTAAVEDTSAVEDTAAVEGTEEVKETEENKETEPVKETETDGDNTGKPAENKIQKLVDEHGEYLASMFKEGFEKGSGLTCTATAKAEENGIVLVVCIDALDDLTEDMKKQFQDSLDGMGSSYESKMSDIAKLYPELEYITIEICEKDGDHIATVKMAPGEKTPEEQEKSSIQVFVDTYGDDLIEAFEASFVSSGLTCNSSIKAEGNGIVIDVRIDAFDDLTADLKKEMQDEFDLKSASLETGYKDVQKSIPGLEYLTINVCEKDGDLVAAMRFPAVETNSKVQAFVDNYGEGFLQGFEQGFESSGLTCTSSLKAKGNGIVITVCIDQLVDLSDDLKQQMQEAYNSDTSAFDQALSSLKELTPEIEFFEVEICEKDGDLIATIKAGK